MRGKLALLSAWGLAVGAGAGVTVAPELLNPPPWGLIATFVASAIGASLAAGLIVARLGFVARLLVLTGTTGLAVSLASREVLFVPSPTESILFTVLLAPGPAILADLALGRSGSRVCWGMARMLAPLWAGWLCIGVGPNLLDRSVLSDPAAWVEEFAPLGIDASSAMLEVRRCVDHDSPFDFGCVLRAQLLCFGVLLLAGVPPRRWWVDTGESLPPAPLLPRLLGR